ncbi:MAG: hypothetical protein MJY53_01595 [Bacteroidales bacterium]|nr:hypothetical protein [Bacteroidales bacterium]
MKKITLAILTIAMVLTGTNVSAQGKFGADSAECIKYLSYYSEYYKQKSYDEAIPSWRQAYSLCPPEARQSVLIDGTTLVRRLIAKNASNAEYRAALIDTLLTLHDLRVQYYPKYATTALNNKGLDVANYLKNDPERAYRILNEIIEANKEQTKASIYINDFNSAVELFQKGKIGTEDVINAYQRNLGYLDQSPAKTDADVENNKKVRTDLESLFITSKVASCDNLLSLFTPRYEANPNDIDIATNIVKMMSMTEGCTDNELFLKAATTMYKLDPSHTSAYFLFKLNAGRDNVSDAINYMEEAIAYPESDDAKDADYYYELATFCYKNGRNAKAYESARKAADLDGSLAGKCYFLIANIWGATNCGGDEISKRAPYWVAVDYLIKARNADPSLAEEAGRMIGQYSKYYPETAEAFMYDLTDGQSYQVVCNGMSASTTVRTQK